MGPGTQVSDFPTSQALGRGTVGLVSFHELTDQCALILGLGFRIGSTLGRFPAMACYIAATLRR
jgi:hypothetical protein